jgi:TPR repeat protein
MASSEAHSQQEQQKARCANQAAALVSRGLRTQYAMATQHVMCCMFAACVLQRGSGVDVNHQLSLELFRRAAELGDPQAQGMMGMRMAMGLHHYGSFEGASIRQFGPVRDLQDGGCTRYW